MRASLMYDCIGKSLPHACCVPAFCNCSCLKLGMGRYRYQVFDTGFRNGGIVAALCTPKISRRYLYSSTDSALHHIVCMHVRYFMPCQDKIMPGKMHCSMACLEYR